MITRSLVLLSAASLVVVAAIGLASCDLAETKAASTPPPPPRVLAATPVVKSVTEWDEYTGRFVAVESVEVRARVGGYLTGIHFKDGQMVQKGELLFTIDRRPYETAVASAEADLEVAEATLDFARQELKRAASLRNSQTVPERIYDERVSGMRQAEARVHAARATLERARLDLEFTEIRAPVSGRIDSHAVSVGNLVSGGDANSAPLTNIVSLDPIHVVFDVDQNAYLKYVRAAREAPPPSSREVPNPVRVALPDDSGFPHTGQMDFVSNQVDRATATVRARAIVSNPERRFTPGLFARVQIIGSHAYDAVLVPDEAIATDQASRVVFVVKDGKAELRTVTLGPLIDGLRVVRSGLSDNDIVVLSGLQRIRAGQQVAVETSLAANAAKTSNAVQQELPQ